MALIVWSCLAALLASGCATGPATVPEAAPVRSEGTAGQLPTSSSSEPAGRLDERVQGRIVFVNSGLRFVVMDFPIHRVPAVDQRLGVYRQEEKVGEVKATGPIRETTVAGDLTAGEARPGDEVREE